jgi:hypothetical protein
MIQDPRDPKWEWRHNAKCRDVIANHPEEGITTETFYPPRNKDLYKPIADKAKAICKGKDGRPECPVRMNCLREEMVEHQGRHGIFGGMSNRERNALERRVVRAGSTLSEYFEGFGL